MNVKLLTKEFFKSRGGEQLDELDDRTKVLDFIKLPRTVNDYTGDKAQVKFFKFSSTDTDMFDDKSGSSGHFAFSFNQPKGLKALDEFYGEMLPPIDYSGELPEYYEYGLNKGKTTEDRIVDQLRANAIDEDATQLPNAQKLYPQLKAQKGEAFERFKAQFEQYKAELPIKKEEIQEADEEEGKLTTPPKIEVQPVKKYKMQTRESRQAELRAKKIEKLSGEIRQNESAENIQKVFRGSRARQAIKEEKVKPKKDETKAETKVVTKVRESFTSPKLLQPSKREKKRRETPESLSSPLEYTTPQENHEIQVLTKSDKKKEKQGKNLEKELKQEKKKTQLLSEDDIETSDTSSKSDSDDSYETGSESEGEKENATQLDKAIQLKKEVEALIGGVEEERRKDMEATTAILTQYALLKDWGIISKKSTSTKLEKILGNLMKNEQINQRIQKKENEEIEKRKAMNYQSESRQTRSQRKKSHSGKLEKSVKA